MTALTEKRPYSPRTALIILVAVPLLVFLFASEHRSVLSIFFTALLFWFTEAIPLPVTALLIPILISLFGLVPAAEVFSPFGNDILFLFLGCFLMGLSMAKHGFDRRVAYWLLARCVPGDSLLAINTVVAGASFLLSMWISNTAATAIMCAVTVGILDSLRDKLPDESAFSAVNARLLLSCAFAASIGGLATPIGSPPNLIALKFLANHGIEISFVKWMAFGLPVSLLMFGALFALFELQYPIRGIRVEQARAYFSEALRSMGKMRLAEKQIAVIFLVTVVLWILPSVLSSALPNEAWVKTLNDRLSMSVVGLLAGVLVFLLPIGEDACGKQPNLDWSETTSIDWGTILLFGGGLALGNLLQTSGAAKDFGAVIFGAGGQNNAILVGTIIVAGILLSEFASNTASAAILIPLVIGAADSMGASDEVLRLLVLAVAFSASFGFMLPVSTPPNAIVYGTGRIRSRDMLKIGMWFDVVGGGIIAAFAAALLMSS